MIGIHNFGWRLGNQMFQIAAAIGLATKFNDKVAFPKWEYAKYFAGDFTPVEFNPTTRYNQPGFHYSEIPYVNGMEIDGYFQSEKFFANCKKQIRNMFSFNYTGQSFNLLVGSNAAAIHVRRGDYLKYPDHHPTQTNEYYRISIGRLLDTCPEIRQMIVFSDDPEWCSKQEVFKDCKIAAGDEIEDFRNMTKCSHFIISNSSYSWWAAWLANNPTKRVIAPKNWFGPAYAGFNTKDLYCKGWEVL